MHWFDKLLYLVFFPVVCIGSIFSPLTNDVRIFYGVEWLAKTYGIFPHSISYYWEIKPIMNHIVNYALVEFTCFFIPFQNHFAQEILIKTVAVVIGILACWYFSRNILKIKHGFLLCFFGMFCGLNLNILQAEWWAVIFAMVSCALFVEKTPVLYYTAGALLIPVLLFKGTTGALIVTTVCIVIIVNKNIDWVRGGIGFIYAGILFELAWLAVWPEMIPDILIAPLLSHVGEYNWFGQVYVTAVAIIISMSIYVPLIGLGIVFGTIWLKKYLRDPRATPFALMWLSPLFMVWFQSESFAYQYYSFVPCALMSIVLYEKEIPVSTPTKKWKRENLVTFAVVILFILYCALYSPISKYGNEERAMNDFFWNQSEQINNEFDLPNQTVLYLDTGSGPYYFGANTSCRYMAPLVVQRGNPNRTAVMNLSQYWDETKCILNYNGKFIVADGPIGPGDGWFGNDTVEKQEIIVKIKTEYADVHSGGWEIYKRK